MRIHFSLNILQLKMMHIIFIFTNLMHHTIAYINFIVLRLTLDENIIN